MSDELLGQNDGDIIEFEDIPLALNQRDQRIAELEERLKFAEELIGWETYYFKHGPHPYVWWRRPIGKSEYEVCHELPKREVIEADNTRLREALDKISNKAKCVCMLEVGRGVGDCETCKIADEALAPQPAKEGE